MKRKLSNTSFNDLVPHSNVAKSEQLELQGLFKRAEQKGTGITFYDLIKILRSICVFIQTFIPLVKKERMKCSRTS